MATRENVTPDGTKLPSLSDAQLRVLAAFDKLWRGDALNRKPTHKAIALEIGRAPSTVHEHLLELKRSGVIGGAAGQVHFGWVTDLGAEVLGRTHPETRPSADTDD